jgi:hypothetical protein
MEVIFIRNDLIHNISITNPINLPHSLDRKNLEQNENIVMLDLVKKID